MALLEVAATSAVRWLMRKAVRRGGPSSVVMEMPSCQRDGAGVVRRMRGGVSMRAGR